MSKNIDHPPSVDCAASAGIPRLGGSPARVLYFIPSLRPRPGGGHRQTPRPATRLPATASARSIRGPPTVLPRVAVCGRYIFHAVWCL